MLQGGNTAMEGMDEILTALHTQNIDSIIERGLHEYLDSLQMRLGNVTGAITTSFFGQSATAGQQQNHGA